MQIVSNKPYQTPTSATKKPQYRIPDIALEDIQSIQGNIQFRANTLLETGDTMKIEYTHTDHEAIADLEELFMDNNKTFYLFEGSLDHVLEKGYEKTTAVKIPLYIADIHDKNFIPILEQKKQAGLYTGNIILHIRSEDYGLIDSIAMTNLIVAEQLGYQIAMENAFRARGKVIEASERFQKIDSILTNPIQTSIDAELYAKYTNKELRPISREIEQKIQHSDIVHFPKKHAVTTYARDALNYDRFIQFFRESSIIPEPIFNKSGNLIGCELVFHNTTIGTDKALDTLKRFSGTEALLQYTLEKAKAKIQSDNIPTTVNVFLKDLSSPYFQSIVTTTLGQQATQEGIAIRNKKGLWNKEKELLVFEILADEYGQMNEQALENIGFIKNTLKAKIAIDNYHDEGDTSAGNISAETLGILDEFKNKFKQENSAEAEILPDFIKIDSNTVRSVLDNTINPRYISHLRELIGIYSLYNIEFVFEGIQTTEDAIRIDSLFQRKKLNPATGKMMDGGRFGYQGEKLKEYQFGTRNAGKRNTHNI